RQLAFQVGQTASDRLRPVLLLPQCRVGGLLPQVGHLGSHRLRVDHGLDAVELRRQFRYLIGGIGSCHAESLLGAHATSVLTTAAARIGMGRRRHRAARVPVSSSTVTIAQGRRRARPRGRLASGLAVMATAALGIAGCTSGAPSTSTSTGQASSGGASAPALTMTGAQTAYSAYLAASDRASITGNRSLAMSVVDDVQAALVDTQFNVARATGAKPPFARYSYGTPTIILPEAAPAGGPQYFVVSVERTPVTATGAPATSAPANPAASTTTAPGGVPSPDLAAGVTLPAQGHVLMVFQRSATSATWRLASTSQLAPGQSVPQLATDSRGYVPIESMSAPDAGQL